MDNDKLPFPLRTEHVSARDLSTVMPPGASCKEYIQRVWCGCEVCAAKQEKELRSGHMSDSACFSCEVMQGKQNRRVLSVYI